VLEHFTATTAAIEAQRPGLPIGYLCVVIGPATFWAAITFVVCSLFGIAAAAQLAVLCFVAATGLLAFVANVLRVRSH